jgi:hypothetical protein
VDLLAQTEKIIRTLRWKKLANENTLPQQVMSVFRPCAAFCVQSPHAFNSFS